MEINTIQSNSVYQASQKIQPSQIPQLKAAANQADSQTAIPLPQDEYIRSEQSSEKPSGLYKVIPDDKGKPKILYDNPQKAAEKQAENTKAANSDNKSEKCTINTDMVDREIEKLKEKRDQLELEIKQSSEDEKKVKDLKWELSNVENELSQKDNDAYRRQNAETKA